MSSKKKVINLVGVVGIGIFLILANSYVFSKLWEWFIAPTFGLPELPLKAAAGIIITKEFLTLLRPEKSKEENGTLSNFLANYLMFILFTLLLGWIIHSL